MPGVGIGLALAVCSHGEGDITGGDAASTAPGATSSATGWTVGVVAAPMASTAPGATSASSAATSWNMATAPGLFSWVQAQAAEITIATGVSQWNDRAGTPHNYTQSTASAQPARQTAYVNGKDVVTFDGTNDVLNTGAVVLSQPCHRFIACKFEAGAGADVYVLSAGLNNLSLIRHDATTMRAYSGTVLALTTTPGNWHVFDVVFNGASSKIGVDGGTQTVGNAGAANGTSLQIAATSTIQFANVSVRQIVDYSQECSSGNRASIIAAMKADIGI